MSGTLILLSICCLSIACQGLQHDVNIDITQFRNELWRQGEITDALLELVQDQHTRIATQEERIEGQAKRIADLENKNSLLEEILSTRHDLNTSAGIFPPSQETYGDVSRTTNEGMTARMVPPRLNDRAVEGPVAFQAGVTARAVTHIRLGEKLVFDNVKLNLGGGYHSQFGLFITPKAGIYIFSVTILSNSHSDIEAAIMKNGVEIGRAYANLAHADGLDQGSVTVVLQLEIGDEVYVQNGWPDDTSLRGYTCSDFMGCLIMEL